MFGITPTTAKIFWRASGDDGQSGTAATYEIRYSTAPIDASNWTGASLALNPPAPSGPLTWQSYQFSNLIPFATYYAAIKVKDEAGNISPLSQIVSFNTQNSTMLTGWPKDIVYLDHVTGDVDNDGDVEIGVISGTHGAYIQMVSNIQVHLYHHDGTEMAGNWPRLINTGTVGDNVSMAFADLNGDGYLEIIAVKEVSSPAAVYVFDRFGNDFPGWPQSVQYAGGRPHFSVGDVDNDGKKEIVYLGANQLVVLGANGNPLPGWPKTVGSGGRASPCLVDLDKDGDLEIVVALSSIYAFHHDGSAVAGWPVSINAYSVVAGDIDNDGKMEIVATTLDRCYLLNANGVQRSGSPLNASSASADVVLADIDGDKDLEIILYNFSSGSERIYHHTGAAAAGWPKLSNGSDFWWPTAVVGDIDNDNQPEIVQVSGSNGRSFAWDANGNAVASWPRSFPGFGAHPPVLADFDNDGQVEILYGFATTFFDFGVTLVIEKLNAPYNPAAMEWPMEYFDREHTSAYKKTALPAPDVTPPAALSPLGLMATGVVSAYLSWFAPGDDGNIGTAAQYDIRISQSLIDETNWSNAQQMLNPPIPLSAGNQQDYTFQALTPRTKYYAGIKTIDEKGNTSGLSNIVTFTTGRYGDITNNNTVSAYDAALAARAAAGQYLLTADQALRAKVAGQPNLSLYEPALIAQYAARLISKFPIEN